MRKFPCLIVLLQFALAVYPQRGNNWQFGFKAGLDFSSGVPVPTNYSQMNQLEGCTSMCDLNGQLIFYSDGIQIWNRHHNVMPNGYGLFGHFSSSQSGMIVPFPADPKRYYVFTVDHVGGSNGLCYSIVNMDLDGGSGDVEQKNIRLVNPTAEKVTSVNHCNGKDVWVITHKKNSDEFYAYLVTSTGVNAPVISHSGRSTITCLGYLKASPDGTRIAAAHYGAGLDLLNFNSITGVISNRQAILDGPPNKELPYGVEFSSNSKLLYVTNGGFPRPGVFRYNIIQYNFLDSSLTKIQSSKFELDADSTNFPVTIFSGLQIAPDGKIYMSVYGERYLAVINNPNIYGAGCNYSRMGLNLASPAWCGYGLPDFNQSYFKASFEYTTSCKTRDVSFYSSKPGNAISSKWDFGDPGSGINNTATIDSPLHHFSAPGVYEIKLITDLGCRYDTMKKIIKIDPAIVDLGPDKSICDNAPYIIIPQTQGSLSYLWQDNSTNPSFSTSQSGLYWLEVKSSVSGCVMRDSIQLTYNTKPIVNLGNDTYLCEKNSLLLDAANPGASFTWQDNNHNQTFMANAPGTYYVTVKQNGCESSDTIVLQGKYLPRISLGNDTTLCNGMSLLLRPVLTYTNNSSLLWSTGETSSFITVNKPGFYSVETRNECGSASDGILIKQGVCQLYVPNAFSPDNDGKNDVFKPGYGDNVVSYSLTIYNRGGQLLFNSNQLSKGWDGKFKGMVQPMGIYAWLIRYKLYHDPKEYLLKGTIMLTY